MNNTNKDIVKTTPFDFYGKGTVLGVLGGLGMAIIAVAASGSESIASSFLKYILLIPFLLFGLVQLRNTYLKGPFFKEGIAFGAYTSFIAAIAFVTINFMTIGAGLREAEKFSYEAESFADVVGYQGVNFFEIMGLGLILTFICLQLLKFTGVNDDARKPVVE